MEIILYCVVQLTVVVMLAPLVNGLIKKIKAFSQKRKGPPLLQMYYDLYKLLKKDVVVSEAASWVFGAAPYVTLVSALTAALFVPVTTIIKPLAFMGDIILAIYLLALGRFFMALGGLDTGSTFGGMGSSREMTISSLMEPSLLVSVLTISLISGSTSVYEMMRAAAQTGMQIFQPVYLLTFAAVFIVILAETARIPVDDPATHLELTMVHEAMVLEYSGRHLALMELGASIKQLIFMTLLANLFIPLDCFISANIWPPLALGISLLLYGLKILLLAVLTALVEVGTVKLRFFSVPNLAAVSFTLAFLGFVQYFVIGW